MPFLRKPGDKAEAQPSAPASVQPDITKPTATGSPEIVRIRKGQSHKLAEAAGGEYTLITTWGEKDYDLYALVEYLDGHVEVVSCFGTTERPADFSMRTKDGAVIHISGDKAASGRSGADLPQEVIHVRLNPQIRTIVPVVYSAKNSSTGSFHRYQVSTYLMEGLHQVVGTGRSSVAVEAVDANRDDHVYTFVPAVIRNGPDGPTVEAVELYSRRSSELRPVIRDGQVIMDAGPENANKPRPKS